MIKKSKLLITVPVLLLFLALFSVFAHAEGDKTGIVTGDSLNVRQSPNTSAKILTQLAKGVEVVIVDASGDWYKITYDGITGWVFGQYVSLKDKQAATGTVNAEEVNVRAYPDLSAEVLTRLGKGASVKIFGRTEEWYKIEISEGKLGWIYRKYVDVKNANSSRCADEIVPVVEAPKKTDEVGKTRQKIVEYAKKFLGVKYVYGGSSPKGFDCSGFVQYVFKNFNINLERVAANQAKYGTKVDKSKLKPGDLVFFDTNGGHNYINHVGIYIGDGKFIHASSGRNSRKVIISDLTEGFYKDAYMTARKYVN